MSSETSPKQNDPLFGNAASDLLREAAGTEGKPPSDPRYWQPPTPEELQSRLTGYVIEAFLARGGMGAVYCGVQTSLERRVAIKILPPQLSEHDASFAQRFKQEARAMAQLNHPGIVKVFDFGEMSDGTLFFIMEFIDGTDVGQMVARQGRLSSAHALAVTAHVCDALQYAHELGIVHRDIKPANIMVSNDGQVKVADFGLAKSFSSGQTSLTMTGHVMGTVHFVAPEALTLGSSVDHRADIYAVGVMLYQMLTGRLPQGIFEMPSLLVKGLDPRYDQIVASAMREDRNARYQSIQEMRRALDDILTQPVAKFQATPQQQGTSAPPANSTSPKAQPDQHIFHPTHRARKKAGAVTWLLFVAVVLSFGGLVSMKMSVPPSDPPLAAGPSTSASASLPSTSEVPTSPPRASIAPFSDPVFEKELSSYSWKIADKDWVVYFQKENLAMVREGGDYRPWRWWVIGPRKIHVQFSGQSPVFDPNTGENWEVKAALTQFSRISDGKLVCERDRSPPASAIGNETGFVTLLGDSGSEGWKYSGHPNGRVNQAYGIYSFKTRSGEDEAGMFWYSKRTFSDFVLRIEFRISEFTKNSGIYLRHPALNEGVQPLNYSQGCEIEIASHKTGTVPFTPQGNLRPPPLIVGDWNTYEITARGNEIEARLNGILTTKYTSTRGTAGYIGIQDFDDNMAIEFRNVRIKETASSTPAILTDKKPADYRTFTDTKGRTIRASLIRTQNDDVTLKTLDGKEHTFKAATLSATDITYLKTKGLVLPQAAFVLAPSILETVWKNRCNQTQRLETLYRAGGVSEAEVAVSAAFEYLKHKQNPDGSWGTLDRAGMTALALMAYVGRCETLESPFYGDNVMKGIMFLIETGKKNSTGLLCVDASSSHAAAEHGLATEALGQMYLTARYGSKSLPGMREAFEKGIRLIIESNPPGSDRARSSLFTLAWQCEALNTAKLAGLKFAGLDECIRHVASTLRTLQNAEGGFAAQPPETPQAITGACLRTLQLFPDGGQAILDRGIRFARQHFQSTPLNYKKMDLFPVYFYTRAFYRKGGDDWRFWNRQMLPQVLSAQQPDGSFSTTPSTFMHGGDIENTALGVLTLETYYRDTPK